MNTNTLEQLKKSYIYALAAYETCNAQINEFLDNDLDYLAQEHVLSEKRRTKMFDDEYKTVLEAHCNFSIEVESNFKKDDFREILRTAEDELVEYFKDFILNSEHAKKDENKSVVELFTTNLYKKVMLNMIHRQRLIDVIMQANIN